MTSNASQQAESPEAPTIKEIIGHNLRAGRDARGLTQRELAVALDIDVMQISRWERGEHRPNAENEAAIAYALFDGDVSRLYDVPLPATPKAA